MTVREQHTSRRNITELIGEKVKFCLNVTGLRWAVAAGRPAYRRLLGLLYPRGIPRYIHGEPALYVSPDARDLPEDKEEGTFRAMKDRIHEGAIVLDVGANLGLYTLLAARWAGETGKVFAFEPMVQTADKLQRHVNMNRLADRIEVIRAAVGNTVGEVVFYYSAACCGHASAAASVVPGGQPQRAPVTTVDVFCQSRGIAPSFLKIDVEGYETHVLDGAQETIQRYTPDLLIETHPNHWQELGLSREQVAERFARLTNLGYQAVDLDGVANYLESQGHVLYCYPARASSNSCRITEGNKSSPL